MITISCLGSNGLLGNQMFQYAALRTISKKFNYQYCLPPIEKFQSDKRHLNLIDCFKLNNEEHEDIDLYKIKLNTLGFDEEIFNKCPDNIDIDGYFQDIKYFENNSEDIKKSFTFKEKYSISGNNYFYSTFKNEDVISLHIRRGDYLNFSHHPTQSIEYYIKALKYFNTSLKVLIFTDDVEWARNQDIFKSKRFFFSTNNDTGVDMYMQTLCSHHIIANSTFSWWGAWLANSKIVIKPKTWFGPPLENYNNFLNVNGWINI
jgi:cupin superfamily acireductone dioxygenase involved in methionine salvage